MFTIEKGIFTTTTKQRLEELEEQKKELSEKLLIEECKKKSIISNKWFYTLILFANLFHGVLDTSLSEMVILGHADKGKKLQAIIFSCPWQQAYTISTHVKNLSRHKQIKKSEDLYNLNSLLK